MVLTGGSTNNTAFAKQKLINELLLDVQSIIVGKGISLFAPGDFDLNLELLQVKKINPEIIQLHYKVA